MTPSGARWLKLNISNKRPTCGKRDSGELEMTSQIDCENVCQGEIRVAGHRSVFIHWFCKWLLLLLVTWSVERISVTFFTSGLCSGRDRTHRAAVSNYRPALRLSTSVNLAAAIRFRPAPSSHCQRLTSGFRNFLRCTLESLSLSRLGMNEFFFLFSKQNSWSRSRQPRWSLRHWNGWLDAFDGYNYIKRSSH